MLLKLKLNKRIIVHVNQGKPVKHACPSGMSLSIPYTTLLRLPPLLKTKIVLPIMFK